MSLTTLGQVKSFLNVPDSSQDGWLDSLRVAAEAVVRQRCSRDFELGTYTEFHSGNGLRTLPLRQRPVVSVQDVRLDHGAYYGFSPGSFDSTTVLNPGADWALDIDGADGTSRSGILIRVRTDWSEVPRFYQPGKLYAQEGPSYGNIRVQYTAGFAVVPQDVQYAVCFIASYMKRTIGLGADASQERVQNYSYDIFRPRNPQGWAPEIATAEQILSRYRETF